MIGISIKGHFQYTTEGTTNIEYYSIDIYDNIEKVKTAVIRIDKGYPTISMSSPIENADYLLNEYITAEWNNSKTISGISNISPIDNWDLIDTSTVGAKVFEVTITTNAGNSTTQTIDYNVTAVITPLPQIVRLSDNGWDTSGIGNWNAVTHTATLINDVTMPIYIDSDKIILEGAGHSLTGNSIGSGIYISSRTGITINNVIIDHFPCGITIINSTNIQVSNSNIKKASKGINPINSQNITINNNVLEHNFYGIENYNCSELYIKYNLIDSNQTGFNISESDNLTIQYNTISNNSYSGTNIYHNSYYGLTISNNSIGSTIYNNNFINNPFSIYDDYSINIFNISPENGGGNYWSEHTSPDENHDGFVDTPYDIIHNNVDLYPFVQANGWLPNTSIAIEGIVGSTGAYISDVLVTLIPADGYAGFSINFTEYRINNGNWVTYSIPFTISSLGVIDIDYRSKNVNGALEEIKTKTIENIMAIEFAASAYTVSKSSGTALLTVQRTGGSEGESTINYSSVGGTAPIGVYYQPVSGSLVFAEGEISKTFTIPIYNDANYSGDGTVNLVLNSPSGNVILGYQNTSILYIKDDSVLPSSPSFEIVTYTGEKDTLNSTAYGNFIFITVGNSGIILRSLDGINWAQVQINSFNNLYNVIFDGTKFIVVGGNGTVLTSLDGILWTAANTKTFNDFSSIVFGGGMYVALNTSNNSTRIYISTNGVDWAPLLELSAYLVQITYGNDRFIAVGQSGEIFISLDGITWSQTLQVQNRLNDITFGNGLFIAIGANGTELLSQDGYEWESQSSPTTDNLLSVSYSNGIFIATGSVLTSIDGVNWTNYPILNNYTITSATYFNGEFILTGPDGLIIIFNPGLSLSPIKTPSRGIRFFD